MLFRKKKCENCQSEYDVVETTCPACGATNADVEKLRINQNIIWTPWYRQLILFLIGSLGLQIGATIIGLITFSMMGRTLEASLTANVLGYLVTVFGLIAALFPYFKRSLQSFKKWLPYVVGLGGAVAIYIANAFYSSVVSMFIESTVNENESTARTMITAYPVAALFMTVILGPVAEELTYRVGLFSLLKRVNTVLAYIGTIIIFAMIHFDVTAIGTDAFINELINLPFYMGAGAIMCFLYDRFGLAASLTTHITNNLISSLLALLLGALA